MSAPLLQVEELRVAFGDVEAVRGVSFTLERGQRLGLVGESGSGKSLTALALMRLLRAPGRIAGGRVVLDGTDLTALPERAMRAVRGGRIAMVYQDPMTALNPVQRVGRQLVEAIRLHRDASRRAARARAVELLAEVGVPEPERRMDAYPHELSGGMRQRVVIAMALAAEPDVLLCDEPTTALDVTTQARIMDLLSGIVEQHGTAVVLITHDLGVAAGFCDSVQVMYAGRIVERSPVQPLYDHPLHPYAEALLGSACDLALDLERPIPAIGGQPPQAGSAPSGCAFHPRCPYALEVCRTTDPVLTDHDGVLAACHRAEERAAAARKGAIDVGA